MSKALAVANLALEVFGATFEIALGPIGLVILALAALGVGICCCE